LSDTYDVVIVGGGYAGLATAYHLARRRAKVLLLEANSLAGGTSGASAGRAQVSESHRGKHLELVLAALALLEHLEEELDYNFEWRRLGNLMLIDREEHWQWWTEQVGHLNAYNVPAQMLDGKQLNEAEPLLQAGKFMGAAYCLEGHLNPFKYCRAYALAAQRHGAELQQNAPVVNFERQNGRITTVHTPTNNFKTGAVLVTAGAWSGAVLQRAGAWLPVQSTHAEAIISEPLPPVLHNHVGLADFYETIHTQAQAVSVAIAQQKAGTLLITEAVEMTPTIHRRNSHWGIPGMARDVLALFPKLADVRIVRAWAAPSPFLPDEQPAIGWMPGLDNLFVATCFHLTITSIPVLSELIAGMILGESIHPSLEEYSPARFA